MSVNINNWQESPHNQWSFRNVDKIIPTQEVKRGTTVRPLASAPRQFEEFRIQQTDGKTLDLSTWLSHASTDSIVVLHKGTVVYEHYANGNDATSKHLIMSITKSITTLLVGILVEQGKLTVDAPIKSYIPELPSIFDHITVRQSLDMQSGIKYSTDQNEYRAATNWATPDTEDQPKTLHELLTQLKSEADPPGTTLNYTNINTDLLTWVMEKVTGKRYPQLLSELLWQPMGAESDAFITVDPEGSAGSAGGLCATARDLARIGQLVLEDGRGIIPSSWIQDIQQHGDHEAWQQSGLRFILNRSLDNLAYRSSWVTDHDTFMAALGKQGQHLFVDRKSDIVMTKLSSQADPMDLKQIDLAFAALQEFKRLL